MTLPEVSIITNSYNCVAYLRRNVESVLSQDYSNWRHIIVDAGSTDGSIELLKDIDHPRLTVMTVPHCGVSQSRNLAIERATSEFIAILDADDEALPGRLSAPMKCFAESSERALVAGGIVRVDQVSGKERTFVYPTGHDAIMTLLRTTFNPLPHSTMVFRRNDFHRVGGYSMEKAEDFDLAIRLAKFGRLASIGRALVRYAYLRPGSHTEAHRPKGRCAQFYALLALVEEAAQIEGIAISRAGVELWLDALGEGGIAALQGRWASQAVLRAVSDGDTTLAKYLSFLMAIRLPSMARYSRAPWWVHAKSPLEIARHVATNSIA